MLAMPLATAVRAQVELPEINVTAPPPVAPAATEGSFVPVTAIPRQELEAAPGATLGDVLATQPGISTSTFAPGASRPIVRGLDNFRVRVQENGVASMDLSSLGEDHAVPIDPLATERIEVIRGPATLRYGPQAIGGVVSAVNNRIPEPFTPEGFSLTTRGAVTTADVGREGAVLLENRSGNWAFHGDAYGRRAEDYAVPGGRQPNTAMQAAGAAAGGSYIFDRGFIGFAVSEFTSLYHIPGIRAAAINDRIDLNQLKVTGKGELRVDAGMIDTVRFWLGATDYKHNELGVGGNGIDGIQATFKNREQEGRIEAQMRPIPTGLGALTTTFGLQVGHQNLSTSADAANLIAPAETSRFGGYVFNELKLSDTLRLEAAGRISAARVDGTAALFPADLLPNGAGVPETARGRGFAPSSGSIGLLKDLPNGLVARATAQYAERSPEALELFAKGPHDASGTFEIGNPDLKKEAATSFEVGLRRPKGDVRFDVSAYRTHYQGFIFKRLTGVLCGDDFASCGTDTEFKQVVYSQRDANFTGAEASAQLDVGPLAGGTWGVEGQYDIVRARFTDGTNVPRMPPMRLGGGVFWNDGNWRARVNLLHAFAQNEIAPEETRTSGYNYLRADLSYTHKFADGSSGPREMTLGISGTNLLNEDIRLSTSFKKDEVLQPGRGVRFFTTIRW